MHKYLAQTVKALDLSEGKPLFLEPAWRIEDGPSKGLPIYIVGNNIKNIDDFNQKYGKNSILERATGIAIHVRSPGIEFENIETYEKDDINHISNLEAVKEKLNSCSKREFNENKGFFKKTLKLINTNHLETQLVLEKNQRALTRLEYLKKPKKIENDKPNYKC